MLFASGAVAVCLVSGCASPAPERGPSLNASQPGSGGVVPTTSSTATTASERPPVVVEGESITWDSLRPAMVEVAGAIALEEAALDALLSERLAARGVRWSDLDTAAERAIIVAQLAEASPSRNAVRGESAADRGERLLAQLRTARGLGNTRFEGMLRRNAALRLLVNDQVVLNESVIRQAYDLRYGERMPARIIVVDTVDDAAQIIDRLDAGEPFPEVAARFSTDQSASRGGLIEPVSAADPSYPQALRDAIGELRPGGYSTPIALDNGIAIVLREASPSPSAAVPTLEETRSALTHEARMRQERILMGELARELLENARVTIFDASLDKAWRARTGADQ